MGTGVAAYSKQSVVDRLQMWLSVHTYVYMLWTQNKAQNKASADTQLPRYRACDLVGEWLTKRSSMF